MDLDGKILNIFKAMYSAVKSCVKQGNTLSDYKKLNAVGALS
jgi:hypothetical protein